MILYVICKEYVLAKLVKVKTESLRAQVYAQIKASLMDGVWKVGEKLPSESELCATLGVSRVTVRAAIQQLEILGLVETKHGGGTYVRNFSGTSDFDRIHPLIQINKIKDLITILEYRKIVEKGTIGLAANRITSEDISFLEEMLDTMRKNTHNLEKSAEADHQFHCRIAKSTKNPIILKVYNLINDLLSTAMKDIVNIMGNKHALKYHQEIIDALRNGDKELCEAIMEKHIDDTIVGILEDQPKIPS